MPVPVPPLLRSTLFRRAALALCAVTTLVAGATAAAGATPTPASTTPAPAPASTSSTSSTSDTYKVDRGEPQVIHTIRSMGYILRIPPP
jgi:hypothetical protein